MSDKQKISHFDPKGYSNSKSTDNHLPDRSRLAKLYPNPKTYDERKADDKLVQRASRLRWPKHPSLNSAVYGIGVIVLAIWFAQNLGVWWFGGGSGGSVMSAVFFSFAIWMVLMLAVFAWVIYISKLFTYFGGKERLFWVVYGTTLAIVMSIWLSGWVLEYTNPLWILVFAVFHFVLVLTFANRLMDR